MTEQQREMAEKLIEAIRVGNKQQEKLTETISIWMMTGLIIFSMLFSLGLITYICTH